MEFNEKAAARSKFKSSQHLKRVHGGRGRGRGHHTETLTRTPELQSNYDRYEVSDSEEATEGEVVRQSAGADLDQLLRETEQFYAQAHSRYRSFIETVDIEPPPVDVSAVEQELALEPELLIQALAQLPLPELLGLDKQFMVGLSHPGEAPRPREAYQQASVPQQHQQPQQLPSPASVQQQQGASLQQTSATSNISTVNSSTNMQTHGQAASAPYMAKASAASAGDDDDVLLQLLLEGTNMSEDDKTSTATAETVPTTGLAHYPTSHRHSTSKGSGGVEPRPLPDRSLPDRAAGGTAASAVLPPARQAAHLTVKSSAAAVRGGDDDALNDLLESSRAATKPPQRPHQQNSSSITTAGRGGSKKQSLEDWLDAV